MTTFLIICIVLAVLLLAFAIYIFVKPAPTGRVGRNTFNKIRKSVNDAYLSILGNDKSVKKEVDRQIKKRINKINNRRRSTVYNNNAFSMPSIINSIDALDRTTYYNDNIGEKINSIYNDISILASITPDAGVILLVKLFDSIERFFERGIYVNMSMVDDMAKMKMLFAKMKQIRKSSKFRNIKNIYKIAEQLPMEMQDKVKKKLRQVMSDKVDEVDSNTILLVEKMVLQLRNSNEKNEMMSRINSLKELYAVTKDVEINNLNFLTPV